MLVDVVVEQGSNHVVCRGDGMEVACEVEVDFLHWQHLCIATSRSTTFHAEARSEGWLSQCHNGILPNLVESERQTDADGCLADARLGRCDGSDENEFAFRHFFLVNQGFRNFGNILAIILNFFRWNRQFLSNVTDRSKFAFSCNLDICFHNHKSFVDAKIRQNKYMRK